MDDYPQIDHEDLLPDERDLAEQQDLYFDRETLRSVTAELVQLSVAARTAVNSISPRSRRRLEAGAQWVRLPRQAALWLIEAVENPRGQDESGPTPPHPMPTDPIR